MGEQTDTEVVCDIREIGVTGLLEVPSRLPVIESRHGAGGGVLFSPIGSEEHLTWTVAQLLTGFLCPP